MRQPTPIRIDTDTKTNPRPIPHIKHLKRLHHLHTATTPETDGRGDNNNNNNVSPGNPAIIHHRRGQFRRATSLLAPTTLATPLSAV